MRWLSHRGGALDFQEFKKENPFFEAGRSRHIDYTIDGINSTKDVSYTHKNKKGRNACAPRIHSMG
ncbi:MAG: hypothetical protein HRT88_05490 [Lentisphaeraceae bacterium]|nr:hypothetical protein [Lentisphaeraceae bacterium]